MAKDDTPVGTMLAVSTYTNPSRRSILNMSFLTDIHNNTFRNQEVALRKKHLDEKIQIQADRLKQQNEKKLQRAKSNHLKRRLDKEKTAYERHNVNLKKYHRRCNKAIELKKKRHTEIIKRNEALDAHKQFKLDLRNKKENKKEMIKYRKVKQKYNKTWQEDLPLPNPPQEPLSLFKMVQRSPKTNYARSPLKSYGSKQLSVTRASSSYAPTKTNCTLNIVLDYYPGQDLYRHLSLNEAFDEYTVCYYGSQILSALNCLHANKILYRDLKPENIVLTEHGHVKLIDFNISKNNFQDNAVTYTLIGNIEYWAPEQVEKSLGYNFAVDLWQYGVLLYEMFYGFTPFVGKSKLETYSNILNGKYRLLSQNVKRHPPSSSFQSFILALLQTNPKARLGSGFVGKSVVNEFTDCRLHGGMYHVFNHDFFKYHKIDFNNLDTMTAPIIPTPDDKWTSMDKLSKKRQRSVIRYKKHLKMGRLDDIYDDVVKIAFKNFDWELFE